MHLAYAWRLAVRKSSVILALAVAGLVIAFAYTSVTARYSTTTYLKVLPTKGDQDLRAVNPQRFFQTETQAILGDQVLKDAASQLRDGTTVEELRQDVQLSDGSSSDVLGITVSGPTEKRTQERQDAVLAAVDGHDFPGITLTRLWTSPVVAPSRPKPLAAGLTAGAAAGVLLVLLWGAARRPIYHPRYLQVSRDVRTYPLLIDLHHPDQLQRFLNWLGRPVSDVVAVGRTNTEDFQLAAQVGVAAGTGGPTLLVAAVGRATEQAVEEQASLTPPQTSPPVLVVISSNQRKGAAR